jgi:hypothetical protein
MFAPNDHNPFKDPSWRWERARSLRENGKLARYGTEDPGVVMAHQFQIREAGCRTPADRENLMSKYPGIYFAKEIHRRPDQVIRWAMEGYLLGRALPRDIALWTATSDEVVIWYERLFFNVLPHLDADTYIMNVVIGGSVHQAIHERDIGTLWKLAGYTKGPVFLRAMLRTLQVNHITDVADIPRGWEEWFNEALNRKAALTMTSMSGHNNEATVFDSWHRTRELAKEQDGATAESAIAANLSAALGAMPFGVGNGATDLPQLAKYNEGAVELRAHEMIEVAMGLENDNHRKALTWKYPEPKERPGDDGGGGCGPSTPGPA